MYYIRQESRRVAANICDAVELGLASPPVEGKHLRRHEVKQQADKYKADLDATWHARYHRTHASLHGMHSRLDFGSWQATPGVACRGPGPVQCSLCARVCGKSPQPSTRQQ